MHTTVEGQMPTDNSVTGRSEESDLRSTLDELVDAHLESMRARPQRMVNKGVNTLTHQRTFLRAVEKINLAQIEKSLEQGLCPNFMIKVGEEYKNPLDVALRTGNEVLVEKLLDAGARMDACWSLLEQKTLDEERIVQGSVMPLLLKERIRLSSALLQRVLQTMPDVFWEELTKWSEGDWLSAITPQSALPCMQEHVRWVTDEAHQKSVRAMYLRILLQDSEQDQILEHLGDAAAYRFTEVCATASERVAFWKKLTLPNLVQIIEAQRACNAQDVVRFESLWKMALHADSPEALKKLLAPHWYQGNASFKSVLHYIHLSIPIEYEQGARPSMLNTPSAFYKMPEGDLTKKFTSSVAPWRNVSLCVKVPLLTYALKVGAKECTKVLMQSPEHVSNLKQCPLSGALLTIATPVDSIGLMKKMGYPMEQLIDGESGKNPLHYWAHVSQNKALLAQLLRNSESWLGQKNAKGESPLDTIYDQGVRAQILSFLEQEMIKKIMPAKSVAKSTRARL